MTICKAVPSHSRQMYKETRSLVGFAVSLPLLSSIMLSTIFASVLAAVAAAAPIAAPAAFTSPYPSAAHTLILHLTHGGCLNWGVTATDGVGSQYNGAPVVLGGCFSGDPWYNAFYIHRGNGQIVAQMQPNLCLDAGESEYFCMIHF